MQPLKTRRIPRFDEDLNFWISRNTKIAERVERMMEEASLTPGVGIGRPKQLVGGGGFWSRRVTAKDRLLYHVGDRKITFLRCRGHYKDH
jgi:toxin YoeB